MKFIAAISATLSVVGVSIALSMAAGLCAMSSDEGVDFDALARGQLASLFGPLLWSRYPAMPPLSALFEWRALLLTGGAFLLASRAIRGQPHARLLRLFAALAAGCVPFLVGQLVLHDNRELMLCGPWIATMLLGLTYGLTLCAVVSVLELCQRPRHVPSTSLRDAHPLAP